LARPGKSKQVGAWRVRAVVARMVRSRIGEEWPGDIGHGKAGLSVLGKACCGADGHGRRVGAGPG